MDGTWPYAPPPPPPSSPPYYLLFCAWCLEAELSRERRREERRGEGFALFNILIGGEEKRVCARRRFVHVRPIVLFWLILARIGWQERARTRWRLTKGTRGRGMGEERQKKNGNSWQRDQNRWTMQPISRVKHPLSLLLTWVDRHAHDHPCVVCALRYYRHRE